MMSTPSGPESDPFVQADSEPTTRDVPVAITANLQSDERKIDRAFNNGLIAGGCLMAVAMVLMFLLRITSNTNYKADRGGGYLRESFTYSRDFYVPRDYNDSFPLIHRR